MKCYFSQSTNPQKEEHPEDILLDALKRTRYDLETAYSGFNEACDPELIDCYIYEMTALTKRYDYLLHQVSRLRHAQIPEVSEESDAEAPVRPLVSQVLA